MPNADLVLEGGGVRGLGTAGAVIRLLEEGYTFQRVAGTSVGAVAAAFVAAGMDAEELRTVMEELELRLIPDRERLGRRLVPGVPMLSEGVSLLRRHGAYQGAWIHNWIKTVLATKKVTTFADLRRKDSGDSEGLTEDQKYKLVVTATDVTRGRLLRLPWDYHLYGLKPEDQLVADAVRMSLSIPFYFQPRTLTHGDTGQDSVIVDGGVLSNFPVEIFDRTDGAKSRWRTIGVRILPDLPAGMAQLFSLPALKLFPLLQLLQQVVTTAVVGNDQSHLDRPGIRDRTITVDLPALGVTDFGLNLAQRQEAVSRGWAAADAYVRRCPTDPQNSSPAFPATSPGRR
ncbi:patatin-like phospholipase family protein [Streptomyces sp. LRE541]|uniref:patatin-like phospholipase family protein n=1 Tax=Streptomyces sp. LRE541 TaxID=2931983 RepID=UPI00200C4F3D|nr:patatin-like phospholipase family protein [Streptomyces sp. LRE541]UPZ26718.1 patatin-like phospholipase family protein [Streptomyces sp. LRE541]